MIAILLAGVLPVWLFGSRDTGLARSFWMSDFRAFYCAGRATAAGADPYRVEPLMGCERSIGEVATARFAVPVPAPLAPFTLPVFALLARAPFTVAVSIWAIVVVASGIAIIASLRSLTRLPVTAITACTSLSITCLSLYLGQLVAPAIALLCVTALLLERRRYSAAACTAAGTLIEPHIGIPLCLALALWVPGTRVALVAAGATMAAVSGALLAPAVLWSEYLHVVLPGQVLAEVRYPEQYSVTYLAFRLGLPDGTAVATGELAFLIALIVSVVAAKRLSERFGTVAAIALVPPALSVIAGPYVHLTQLGAAIPAALLLYGKTSPAGSRSLGARSLGVALVLLAVPWESAIGVVTVLPLAMIAFAVIVRYLLRGSAIATAAATVAAMAWIVLARSVATQWYHRSLPKMADTSYAHDAWRIFVGNGTWPYGADVAFTLLKLPTVAGIILIILWVVRAASYARRRSSTLIQAAAVT